MKLTMKLEQIRKDIMEAELEKKKRVRARTNEERQHGCRTRKEKRENQKKERVRDRNSGIYQKETKVILLLKSENVNNFEQLVNQSVKNALVESPG